MNMKAGIILNFFLLCCITGISQSVALQWARSFGSGANDYGTSVAIDNSGNVYSVGYFASTIDFDSGPGVFSVATNGHFDIYITKLDANGNLLWAKTIGGTRADDASSIALDNSGNVYYGGHFGNVVDFDPGPGVFNMSTSDPNSSAAFISKLDPNGNFLWANKFENINLLSLTVDVNGNSFSTGGFYNIVDFDPGLGTFNLTSTGSQDAFILKLDQTGNFQWAKQMGGDKLDQAWGINLDPSGNVVTTGHFSGSGDFDPGTNQAFLTASGTLMDIFITKLDPAGNFIWAKRVGGTMEDYARDVTIDATGDISICGTFFSTTDFDPGPGQFDMDWINGRMFVLKLNSAGDFRWAKQLGSNNEALATAIARDAFGNVYTTGYYRGTGDFDPGPGVFNLTANGSQDFFISKLDNNGNFIWAKGMGSVINYDSGLDIKIDNSRNIYTTGHFWGTVDFDPEAGIYNLTMVDYGDAFVQKLSQCLNVTYNNITTTACFAYTLNNQTYMHSGIYTQVLQNVSGCDSLITLNLMISGSNDTLNYTTCNSYIWNGQTYTSSGFYRDTLMSAGGCDSIINLNLTINNSIATTINTTICQGQSYAGYTATGTYVNSFIGINGCDSTRTLNLIVKPKAYSTISTAICQGQTYLGHNSTGTFIDTLIATNGCDSIRTINLVVNPTKTTNINASICEGSFYHAGGADQFIAGIYRDTLQTHMGCDSIIVTHLLVNSKPKPNLGTDRNLCQNETITFNPGSFASYLWQDQSNVTGFIANSVGTYWVQVTDNNNCTGSDTVDIKNILPAPAGFLKQTDTICQYDKITIAALNSFSRYSWSNGSSQPMITVDRPGQYILTVTDVNNCPGKDTIQIISKLCTTGVFIPTGFTPNGDQLNDIFRARVYGIPETFLLQVFDRWGNLVFNSTDPIKGWDGTIKGIPIGTSVFVWQCSYKLAGEKAGFQKGTLTLIR